MNLNDAFISYGRADSKSFATKLHAQLRAAGLNIWFDQEDIPLAVDFQEQINDGIEKAHNFLFIIAPHSINSAYCLKEIELAIKLNKRIIPLLHVEKISRDTWQQRNPQKTEDDWQEYQKKGLHSSFDNIHPTISKINWIYFREDIDDFSTSFTGLLSALSKHQDYVEQHTILLVKALEWSRNQQQNNYLLVGEEREKADNWLKRKFTEEQAPCIPTDLHCEHICESIKNANNLLCQVFLSYSEKQNAIKGKIRITLMRQGLTVWTNKTDIKTGIAFQEAINQGIEGSNNIVYLMSLDSLNSEYCQQEIDHALKYNKRIIPLLIEENLDLELIPEQLHKLQFIDFTELDEEERYRLSADKLLLELKQEPSYYEQHKVLLVKAIKWKKQNQNSSLLLRGYNLQHFEAWLKVAKQRTDYPPLVLQEEYVAASLNRPEESSLEVFISYSRANADFARKLNDALQELGKTTWFDQESIATGSDFQQEIYQGIKSSDNFLFIISPKSVNSPYCADEVEYAEKLHKRFVTILHHPLSAEDFKKLPPALASVQWLDFNQHGGEFYANFNELVRTLNTDREHVKSHTKWSQRALEWQEKGKSADLLLRGSEFSLAEAWLKTAELEKKNPPVTSLQQEFMSQSREAIRGIEKREKRQLLVLRSLLVLAVGASGVAFIKTNEAERQKQTAISAEAKAYTQKVNAEITAENYKVQNLLSANLNLEALMNGLKLGKDLKKDKNVDPDTKSLVISTLQQIVYGVSEYNRLEGSSVAFSPDGKYIATASYDSTVKLWNLQGQLLYTFSVHSNSVKSVAFSPDGKSIATASNDKTVKLWNVQGKLLHTFSGHRDSVNSVAFSPDGKSIATASNDKTVKLWNVQGKLLHTFSGHRDSVNSVAFSPDGKSIATASDDNTVKLWNVQGKLLQNFSGHSSAVNSVAFSPDGKSIASASLDNTVKLWNIQGKFLQNFSGHSSAVNSVAFSPDGKSIASASWDNTVKLWNIQDQQLLHTFSGHSNFVMSVAFSPDGKSIASASLDNTVKLWNLQGKLLHTFSGHSNFVMSVAFSPDGKSIASASGDKTVKLWNLQGKLLHTFSGHRDSVNRVAFSPDGKSIASASGDKTVKLWNLQGKLLHTFSGHRDSVNSVAFSPDGKSIASASSDNTVKLWNLQGKLLHTFSGHSNPVLSVAFSPDGKSIASASVDTTVKLWNLQGKLLHTFSGHSNFVNSVAFSPDGKSIASASSDNTVKLWNLQGKLLHTFSGHSNPVNSVAFSPDGESIATASDDHTVKLWNRQGKFLHTFTGHSNPVLSVAFSPDGKSIASASVDRTVKLWNMDLDDLLVKGCSLISDYLHNNPSMKGSEDRHLCDDVRGCLKSEKGGKKAL